jgi:hypothetical protein
MKKVSFKPLELTAFVSVGFNFLVVVMHSVAHKVLGVRANAAQLAFIIAVIIIAPLVAGFVLPKFKKAGAILLMLSMLGSFSFGLYYHFIANTIDHVAHVAHLEPAFWALTFEVTACLLLLAEVPGAIAGLLLLSQSPNFKNYAARTDFQ